MLSIENITCEHVTNPLSVTTKNPRFSWELKADKNNIYQKAYQIQVQNEKGEIVWDSGRQEDSRTTEVSYQGKALESSACYQYSITIWELDGREVRSSLTKFETALFTKEDWRANWIEPEPLPQLPENPLIKAKEKWMEFVSAMMRGENPEFHPEDTMMEALPLAPYDPAVRMRREFIIQKEIKRARLYITAHGIYEVKINGNEITDAVLTPGFTTYDKRIKYQVYDVDSFLDEGKNAIGVTIADGWYKGKIALGRGCEYGEVPGLLLKLLVNYEDGMKEEICSDGEWSYSFEGPIRSADLFLGEKVDARMEDGDHSVAGFKDLEWKKVFVKNKAEDMAEALEAQIEPYVKVFARILAQKIWTAPNGDTLVDFGQNLAGHIRVVMKDMEVGEEITIEHGEVLDENGNFTYAFTDTTRAQKDVYICSGTGEEVFEPKFTYHGFRYVRIKGGRNWNTDQFTAAAISSDNTVTGSFQCSDERLNQLQHNIYWSQRTNNISIPTDCPTREKAGWTGDVVVYAPTALYNQDMTAFYEDWLRSIRAEQTAHGHVLNTVPQIKNYVQQSMAGSLGWGDVILTLPWQLYQLCGDFQVLEENYDAMGKWMRAMRDAAYELPREINSITKSLHTDSSLTDSDLAGRHLENQHYLINTGFHFGDWLVPSVKNEHGFSDGPASSFLTMNYVDTSLLAGISDLYADISEILLHHDTAKEYRSYVKRVREAFYEEYVKEDGKLGQDMQGNYILALVHHMVPPEKEALLAKRLDELIHENGDCLDTGFMSVAYLLDVLCDYGYSDTAWKVLWQDKCPSWMYEINHGATTMWENWDAVKEDGRVDGCSFNHYAFGCVGDFMYRRILGIRKEAVGYDKIRIAPAYRCGLLWAEGSYKSIHGEILVRWEKKESKYLVSGSIPANTTAILILPDGSERELGNGEFLSIT